jgi:hypothetical protein
MRLTTVLEDGVRRLGVVDPDSGTVAIPDHVPGVDELVRSGTTQVLDAVRHAVRSAPVRPLVDVHLVAPIARFNRDILCTGWNYWDHFEESAGKREGQDPTARPEHPTFFSKGPDTIIGPHDDIAYDPSISLSGTTKPRSPSSSAGTAVPSRRNGRWITSSASALRTTCPSAICNANTADSGSKARASTARCPSARGSPRSMTSLTPGR